jgi:hypothetical protein
MIAKTIVKIQSPIFHNVYRTNPAARQQYVPEGWYRTRQTN